MHLKDEGQSKCKCVCSMRLLKLDGRCFWKRALDGADALGWSGLPGLAQSRVWAVDFISGHESHVVWDDALLS